MVKEFGDIVKSTETFVKNPEGKVKSGFDLPVQDSNSDGLADGNERLGNGFDGPWDTGGEKSLEDNHLPDDNKDQGEIQNNKSDVDEESQIRKNQEAGKIREDGVESELQNQYAKEDGYHIQKQAYLRDINGNIVRDPVTGEGRRVDFVVIKDGQVVKSVEVTSMNSPKDSQVAKESRIREAGGNYVGDRRTGDLVPFNRNIQTEIVRRA